MSEYSGHCPTPPTHTHPVIPQLLSLSKGGRTWWQGEEEEGEWQRKREKGGEIETRVRRLTGREERSGRGGRREVKRGEEEGGEERRRRTEEDAQPDLQGGWREGKAGRRGAHGGCSR